MSFSNGGFLDDPTGTCRHLDQIRPVTTHKRMPRMPEGGRHVGASSLVSDLRPCRLLRQLKE